MRQTTSAYREVSKQDVRKELFGLRCWLKGFQCDNISTHSLSFSSPDLNNLEQYCRMPLQQRVSSSFSSTHAVRDRRFVYIHF